MTAQAPLPEPAEDVEPSAGDLQRSASGQPAWVRISRGIVLPWLLDGQLWQLKIRTNRQDPKYLAIAGGHPCLFGADTLVPGEPAILAEGEVDALLLWQEVGDLVGVATLGSCNKGISAKALRYLLGCPQLLVAYDVDAEGEKGVKRRKHRTSLNKWTRDELADHRVSAY